MAGKTLEIVFDYSSPYAYFGSLLVEAVAAKHKAQVVWTPVVLGGIFQARGHVAPIMGDKVKGGYLLEDLKNLSEVHGVPYRPRTEFIVKSILPLRATLGVPQGQAVSEGPGRARAVHALFHGAWAEDLDMSDPANVKRLLDQAGFDGAKLVEGAQQQHIKDELKANTDRAMQRGVFGTPTFLIDGGRKFWGHDRLHVADHYLGLAKAS